MTTGILAWETMRVLDGGLMEGRIIRKAEKRLIIFTLEKATASS